VGKELNCRGIQKITKGVLLNGPKI
jgi:hypothetical protein